jgi:hypothetical protein
VSLGECFCACRLLGENKWRSFTRMLIESITVEYFCNIPLPPASLGAVAKQLVHSFDEQGISCRKYNSRTIFWTFPLFVDLTNTLLEMVEAYGSEAIDLLRLVMVAIILSRMYTRRSVTMRLKFRSVNASVSDKISVGVGYSIEASVYQRSTS